MTKIEISTDSVIKVGLPIITLLVFFALLNINNAGVGLTSLTVTDILFALSWVFIIDIFIVIGIIVLFFVLVAIIS